MGDRTYCELTVLKQDRKRAEKLLHHQGDPDEKHEAEGVVIFGFNEVNYGQLDEDFRHTLIQEGIPFTWRWHAGGDYNAGHEYVRFTPEGELWSCELSDEEQNPGLGGLLALIDDPAKLREHILAFAKETLPLPWDNQADYAKLYRARKLIGATKET